MTGRKPSAGVNLPRIEEVTVQVRMRNSAPVEHVDGEPVPLGSGAVTTVLSVPDGWSVEETVRSITDPSQGAWAHHSTEAPAWVAAEDRAVATALGEHYGCPVHKFKES